MDSNSAIVKLDNVEHLKAVKRNINNSSKNSKAISAVENIERFKPYVANVEKRSTVKISMFNFLNYEMNGAIRTLFYRFCEEKGLRVKEVNYSRGLIVYKTKATQSQLDSISDFEALESITLMPEYSLGMDFMETTEKIEIKEPIKNEVYPILGILDSGIARNKYLKNWIEERLFSSYPTDCTDPAHGACVSSIIIYGDCLERKLWTGSSGCKLFDATVFPDSKKEKISEDELIANIREAINKNSSIKIWNLSLGTKIEADLNDFSDFGKALDEIQLLNEVIICKSAGNCTNFEKGFPKSRIAKSGDSIRSLVVGSITHIKNQYDIAEENHLSPFSRIGPGPANSIKPDLVSYGGNAGKSEGKVIPNGVKAIATNGSVVKVIGTSFSTPRVTSLLAELNFKINEKFNPTLLKALAIHSAKFPSALSIPISDKIKQMGFGVASSADEIIYNSPHEITLILQENINKGEYIEILDFPFPEKMVDEDDYFYGDIKVTLVGQPILIEKQGSEYCQSNLEIKFGTYEKIKDRDVTKSNVLNPIGRENPQNVLLTSNFRNKYVKGNESEYARERVLLHYGNKYQPIKKYSINLSEMKDARQKDCLEHKRKWYLEIKGTYRHFAETMAIDDGELLNQDFTMIMTIRDPQGHRQIYNEGSRLLTDRNFKYSNIKLREEVKIDVNNKNTG
ncbi:MAG: S8 family peptidase [Flavobacteriaceae bacterium]|nr:S8 family peptidase [Flavobacteriaceae bacterium]MCY4267475.1 S8 family peptidase [Flavobacteriaceae bacterium]MCY4298176.1 S8 family peptidase [Flavobacteriaceae bacterium]